ncbi:D-beta-hydroxybutyrate dehydrogenase-like isoform X2 [Haliotis rufescens]|uniref:D-beta-hydroxybutyrate dehydrogenase-like isoform X2 n=1 Tax=Haliotis rufescens TaxID=6454 RepID=UPI00201F11C0|nr:D-beta-hydroxybutyrate dehydrogenase-like isoform X2 [Haliotis rufescens]
MPGSLKGLVALVTGATSGIGLGIAHSLARRGCSIVVNGLGDAKLFAEIKEDFVKQHGVDTHFSGENLAKLSEIQKLHGDVIKLYPRGVDILVNNAGFQHVCPVESFPTEKWDSMIAVMLTAPFHLTQMFLPHMRTKGWGRIINMSSCHGHVASANKSAYVSAKHGIIGLTKTVAIETAGSGVTCNAICPGYVETPLFIKQAEDRSRDQGITLEQAKAQIVSVHASGQPVKLEHIGEMAAFLCSPAADQMTGASLVVDGGWTAQ